MTPTQPHDVFTNLIVGFLVPMFIAAAGGDPVLARTAAVQTVNAYQPRTHSDILAVAQVVALGLAALDSLSRSMEDDLPLVLALRLRAGALSATRAAAATTRTLTARTPPATIAEPPPRAAAHPAPNPAQPARTPASRQAEAEHRRTIWANAMTDVAAEFAADLPDLTPAQHRAAITRVAALQNIAAGLRTGHDAHPPARSVPQNPDPVSAPLAF